MFGTKSKSWEYENEIRLIYSTSKRKGYNPFALKSIYFGLNMDEMHQILSMFCKCKQNSVAIQFGSSQQESYFAEVAESIPKEMEYSV